MKKRKLGNSGIEIYPLAFGGNVFGWTVDEPMSFTLLDAFVEAGFSLIDTADVYSRWVQGHNGGENGLGVICYFSVASGFLSGKYRSEADMAKSARRDMVKK